MTADTITNNVYSTVTLSSTGTYGNQIANERKFREPWDCSCREPPSNVVEAQ